MIYQKKCRIWVSEQGKQDSFEFSLPNPNFRNDVRDKGIDVEQAIVDKVEEIIIKFDYSSLDSALALNEVLLYVNKRAEPIDIWSAFIAIQEALGTDIIETYMLLVEEKYELFKDFTDMRELVEYLVRENRIFTRKVSEELLPYLDYELIMNRILKSSNFYETTEGVLWIK